MIRSDSLESKPDSAEPGSPGLAAELMGLAAVELG
jgi:hypothetical protein